MRKPDMMLIMPNDPLGIEMIWRFPNGYGILAQQTWEPLSDTAGSIERNTFDVGILRFEDDDVLNAELVFDVGPDGAAVFVGVDWAGLERIAKRVEGYKD